MKALGIFFWVSLLYWFMYLIRVTFIPGVDSDELTRTLLCAIFWIVMAIYWKMTGKKEE